MMMMMMTITDSRNRLCAQNAEGLFQITVWCALFLRKALGRKMTYKCTSEGRMDEGALTSGQVHNYSNPPRYINQYQPPSFMPMPQKIQINGVKAEITPRVLKKTLDEGEKLSRKDMTLERNERLSYYSRFFPVFSFPLFHPVIPGSGSLEISRI